MKTLKKIVIIYLIFKIIYAGFIFYNKGYKYDANDPDRSLRIMLRFTDPLEREEFLHKFRNVCADSYRCINLHGLTKQEIYYLSDLKEQNIGNNYNE